MGSNAKAFIARLRKDVFIDRLHVKAFKVQYVKVVSEAFRGLVENTKVVTGKTVANWQIGVGQPELGVLDTLDPSRETTIQTGLAKLQNLPDAPVVFITNNVPWIEKLNLATGISDMAFVELRLRFPGLEIS